MATTFIGGGNMATALIGGMLARGAAVTDFRVVEPFPEARARLAARFAGIAFNCAAQLDKVFHVFDTLLKPTHFSSERLQGWFLQAGGVIHRLACDA